MFELGNNPFQNLPKPDPYSENIHTRRYNLASNKFNSALFKGQFTRLLKKTFRKRLWLYDLNSLIPSLGSYYSGMRVVEINRIVGSEGRSSDFDLDFFPIHEKSRERWIGLAVAYLSNLPLPPVALIEVGDFYFVRDGHHRISVSRSFGQFAIDAEVVTWNIQYAFKLEDTLMTLDPRDLKEFSLSARS